MSETVKERRDRLKKEFEKDTDQWASGNGARKSLGFIYVGGKKVFDDYEAYLNG